MDDFKNILLSAGAVVIGIVVIVFTLIFLFISGCFIVGGLEYKTWNKLHGTNYSWYDWSTGSDFIKSYHYPGREKAQINEIKVN